MAGRPYRQITVGSVRLAAIARRCRRGKSDSVGRYLFTQADTARGVSRRCRHWAAWRSHGGCSTSEDRCANQTGRTQRPEVEFRSQGGTCRGDCAQRCRDLVRSRTTYCAAEEAAKGIAAVKAVVDNVEVRLVSEMRTTDEGLAERIANVLKGNVSNQGQGVKAEVKNGTVTLTGGFGSRILT